MPKFLIKLQRVVEVDSFVIERQYSHQVGELCEGVEEFVKKSSMFRGAGESVIVTSEPYVEPTPAELCAQTAEAIHKRVEEGG